MSEQLAVEARDLWKRYGFPLRPYLRQRWDQLRAGAADDREAYGPWALREVSFAIEQGESLGIVGKNGAGKSTLLKLIAGVCPATHGSVKANGRLFPMIELSSGIHRELTGRENIKLLGAIMGFTARQMDAKMPDVEEFSELGDWLDQPVWQYSSGMQARLGFSVAVNVDAEILLIDEVLSVGDVNFRKKCLNRMDELANSGVTIIFVTHNPYAIERICQRALYIKDGRIAAEGSPHDILNAYFESSMDRSTIIDDKTVISAAQREGTGSFRVAGISMHDVKTRQAINSIATGDSALFRIALQVNEPTPHYVFSIRIIDPAGTVLSFVDAPMSTRRQLALTQDCALECQIDHINLLPGQYWVDLRAHEVAGPVIDAVSYAFSFNVEGHSDVIEQLENRGLIYLPARWELADPSVAPTGQGEGTL